jgi:endogenous inhibitor of DNA gyrase (YacG/DUF329 family)
MATKVLKVPCPSCRQPSLYGPGNPWRPFCSARCRGVDLGAWATESYRAAGAVTTRRRTRRAPAPDASPLTRSLRRARSRLFTSCRCPVRSAARAGAAPMSPSTAWPPAEAGRSAAVGRPRAGRWCGSAFSASTAWQPPCSTRSRMAGTLSISSATRARQPSAASAASSSMRIECGRLGMTSSRSATSRSETGLPMRVRPGPGLRRHQVQRLVQQRLQVDGRRRRHVVDHGAVDAADHQPLQRIGRQALRPR